MRARLKEAAIDTVRQFFAAVLVVLSAVLLAFVVVVVLAFISSDPAVMIFIVVGIGIFGALTAINYFRRQGQGL